MLSFFPLSDTAPAFYLGSILSGDTCIIPISLLPPCPNLASWGELGMLNSHSPIPEGKRASFADFEPSRRGKALRTQWPRICPLPPRYHLIKRCTQNLGMDSETDSLLPVPVCKVDHQPEEQRLRTASLPAWCREISAVRSCESKW